MFELDYAKKAEEISNLISDTVHNAGFTKVVVAVSGGVDSAVSLFLTVKALGAKNVYAVLMPYGKMNSEALQHGQLVVQAAGLAKDHVFERDIKSAVDVILSETKDLIRQGNIMARVRMIYLFDLAKELGLLVVGTENKSEHYLGYFTRFGDEASDIEPIRSLYKTQVFAMAKFLGVPKEIIEKHPSANLWDSQTDEKEFGFSYEDADKVLLMHFEQYLRNGDIVAAGIPKETVQKVLEFVEKNDFKHNVPYVYED